MLLEGYNGFAMIKIEKEMKEVNSKEFSVVKIIQCILPMLSLYRQNSWSQLGKESHRTILPLFWLFTLETCCGYEHN